MVTLVKTHNFIMCHNKEIGFPTLLSSSAHHLDINIYNKIHTEIPTSTFSGKNRMAIYETKCHWKGTGRNAIT